MKRKHIQILLLTPLLFAFYLLIASFTSSSQNLNCNSLEDLEREVIKQHRVKKRTSVISRTYDEYLGMVKLKKTTKFGQVK